jgi:hypothetical protein
MSELGALTRATWRLSAPVGNATQWRPLLRSHAERLLPDRRGFRSPMTPSSQGLEPAAFPYHFTLVGATASNWSSVVLFPASLVPMSMKTVVGPIGVPDTSTGIEPLTVLPAAMF